MIFTLEYRQMTRFLSRRYLLLYSVIPLVAFALAVTNDWHGLIWNSIRSSPIVPNMLIYSHGTGFYFLMVYDYLVVLVGLAIMLHAWLQSKNSYRRQTGIILISALFPILGGLAYIFGLNVIHGLDLTPISFLVTGAYPRPGCLPIPYI